jgi:acyl-CoA reductase-like NAD-dependent aldehyde dehydrogenase
VADALAKGAKLACSGRRHPLGPLFYEPTVLVDVPGCLDPAGRNFWPVAAIAAFDTRQVVARANDTEYGLVAYLHSDDSRRIYRVSRALQFGMVAVNRAQVWVRQFHLAAPNNRPGREVPVWAWKNSLKLNTSAEIGREEKRYADQ